MSRLRANNTSETGMVAVSGLTGVAEARGVRHHAFTTPVGFQSEDARAS
jgi:hypothetical protein